MSKYLKIIFALIVISSNLLFSQSDFRITQEFKSRQRSFEIAIEYAKTPDELNKIRKEIDEFKNEFRGNKELLNRALYPSNFELSFTTLEKKVEYSNKKIEEVATLQTKVTTLKTDFDRVTEELMKLSSEVNVLRNSNLKLMAELKSFRSGYGGSKSKIDSLNNLVAQLKSGISQRDTLIKEIMDNIFMTAEHKIESLNDAELKDLKAKVKSTSLIDNINNLVADNIDFLEASLLNPEDLNVLRNEFTQFHDRWDHFGPKLFGIYSTDPQNKEKLVEIDSLITGWDNALDVSTFKSIFEEFKSHDIVLTPFINGEEFEASLISYINSQISNGNNIQVQKDSEQIFFADNVWNDIVKEKWVPILLNNNLITQEQIANIDSKINEWKENVSGSKSLFIYGIILLLAIIIIVTIIIITKRNKSVKELTDKDNLLDEEYDSDEKLNITIDKGDGEDFDDDDFVDDDPSRN
ncbi:MAG: hypothetical protein KDC67_06820 [Ignavibacteriae bacterium]|nr:hypothetical protein [Ignavibacteriota bacterium]